MKQISTDTGICFFRVTQPGPLKAFLSQIDLSPLLSPLGVEDWLEYGCVYVDGRRQRENCDLATGQIIRLHTRRKSYFDLRTDLTTRLIEENSDFVALDKPAGLPTHPTLDNFLENAKTMLERQLGHPLFTTHRLDVPTQGVLILAKTSDAQVKLNRIFSLRRVRKIYRAQTRAAAKIGRHTHFMNPESRVPKQVSLSPQPDWWTLQMDVRWVRRVDAKFAHELELLTGKTHQIRAQLKALNCPIVGDTVYGGESAAELQLECFCMQFRLRQVDFSLERPRSLIPV